MVRRLASIDIYMMIVNLLLQFVQCLLRKHKQLYFAGCGIVKDSDPDSELAETNLKFTPMMNALGVDEWGNHKAALTKQVLLCI